MSHTPGKLRVESGHRGFVLTLDGDGKQYDIAVVRDIGNEDNEANARRLVACWNYCDGISTEDLENDQALANVFNRGLNERAELADALAQAVAFMDGQSTPVNALVNARAILAKHGRQS